MQLVPMTKPRPPHLFSSLIFLAGLASGGILAVLSAASAADLVASVLSVDVAPMPAERAAAPEPAESEAFLEKLPLPAPHSAPPRCGLIPVCRRVPVTITKPHTEYRMETELVCEPACGLAGCLRKHHDGDCESCDAATVRTKKRLVKKITDQKTQSYEYKICWVCRACAGLGGHCPRAAGRDDSLVEAKTLDHLTPRDRFFRAAPFGVPTPRY
jgi:hypothetical protein